MANYYYNLTKKLTIGASTLRTSEYGAVLHLDYALLVQYLSTFGMGMQISGRSFALHVKGPGSQRLTSGVADVQFRKQTTYSGFFLPMESSVDSEKYCDCSTISNAKGIMKRKKNSEFREGEEFGCLFVNHIYRTQLRLVAFPSAFLIVSKNSPIANGSAKAACNESQSQVIVSVISNYHKLTAMTPKTTAIFKKEFMMLNQYGELANCNILLCLSLD